MRSWWRRRSLRARLMLIGVTGLTLGFVGGGASLVAVLGVALERGVDAGIESTARSIATLVETDALPVPVPAPAGDQVQVVDSEGRVIAASADADRILAMQRLARQVPIADHVTQYAARLILATHPDNALCPADVRQHVLYGASPRGMQAMIMAAKINALLEGRRAASLDDVRRLALPALRHRLILSYEARAANVAPDQVVASVLRSVTAPAKV